LRPRARPESGEPTGQRGPADTAVSEGFFPRAFPGGPWSRPALARPACQSRWRIPTAPSWLRCSCGGGCPPERGRRARSTARVPAWRATSSAWRFRARASVVCTGRTLSAGSAQPTYPAHQRRRPAGSRGARQSRAQRAAKQVLLTPTTAGATPPRVTLRAGRRVGSRCARTSAFKDGRHESMAFSLLPGELR
jgi:hypothetical protein